MSGFEAAGLAEAIATLLIGAVLLFLGHRTSGARMGPSSLATPPGARPGRRLRVAGWIVLVAGGANVLWHLPARPHAYWIRYQTLDTRCSAEFPARPSREKVAMAGGPGDRLSLTWTARDAMYLLTVSDLPAEAPAASDEERLDAIRDGLAQARTPSGDQFRLVREERAVVAGRSVRELELAAGTRRTVRMRLFVWDGRIYRVTADTPPGPEDPDTRWFLVSFRPEGGPPEPASGAPDPRPKGTAPE